MHGSAAFAVTSFAATMGMLWLAARDPNWFDLEINRWVAGRVAVISLAGAAVEALPIREWDNLTVFGSSTILSAVLGLR